MGALVLDGRSKHASTPGCYVAVITVKEFSPPCASSIPDVHESAAVSGSGR